MKEIGSEFWNTEPSKHDKVYLLSGRTALEFIIRDIIKNHHVTSVLLPSYCCHTMIEPFCRHGIRVRFYDVYVDANGHLSADVPEINHGEIFYYMTYFGFHRLEGVSIEAIRNTAELIIEDCTHSWLTEKNLACADYSYTSYRKWTGFAGIASAVKHNGFFDELPTSRNEKYYSLRRTAADLKRFYIENGVGDKQKFLSIFNEAEELLENDYVGYISELEDISAFVNIDRRRIKEIRRQNASILIDGLKDVSEIRLVFDKILENDVPLFVPILVQSDRDKFRSFLIDNSIYCPVHWPQSDYHPNPSSKTGVLYNRELSLICDQRYNRNDMENMVRLIKQYRWEEG